MRLTYFSNVSAAYKAPWSIYCINENISLKIFMVTDLTMKTTKVFHHKQKQYTVITLPSKCVS